LSQIVAQALATQAGMLDAAAHANPGRPIEITQHWHAAMGKLEVFVRPVIHLATWKVGRPHDV